MHSFMCHMEHMWRSEFSPPGMCIPGIKELIRQQVPLLAEPSLPFHSKAPLNKKKKKSPTKRKEQI